MTAKLTVHNRQRQVRLSVAELKNNFETLRQAVFKNLIKSTPSHLSDVELKRMSVEGNFSVAFVSNNRIQQLNKEWMGKDQPTDVLSFPLELGPPLLEGMPWEVGEIVISIETAQQQAEHLGHSFQREMAFLFVHGMLHVLGFDHVEPAAEKEMFGRQTHILDETGFKRR